MKRNTLLNVLGYVLFLLSVVSFVLAVQMDTGRQFWIMAFISVGYLTCSLIAFSARSVKGDLE